MARTNAMRRGARWTAARIATTVLAGFLASCATYGPNGVQPGQTVDEVHQALGMETGRYPLPGGATRLEFARGPMGKHTFMVDVDSGGRVTAINQVLTENNFNRVVPGVAADEMLRELGRPSERRGGGWQGGEVWSYRYDATFCQWFQVSVVGGKVLSTGYLPDPICDDDRFGI